mmetsp:Transcript_5440/g.12770  ORF Transcript_5440/g.12770 Transcript_5440/m.12770 type:complete len:244 (-) Transcript_5440:2152-2883(-)
MSSCSLRIAPSLSTICFSYSSIFCTSSGREGLLSYIRCHFCTSRFKSPISPSNAPRSCAKRSSRRCVSSAWTVLRVCMACRWSLLSCCSLAVCAVVRPTISFSNRSVVCFSVACRLAASAFRCSTSACSLVTSASANDRSSLSCCRSLLSTDASLMCACRASFKRSFTTSMACWCCLSSSVTAFLWSLSSDRTLAWCSDDSLWTSSFCLVVSASSCCLWVSVSSLLIPSSSDVCFLVASFISC